MIMSKQSISHDKGVTLIELLITLSLVSMVGLMIFSMLSFGMNSYGMGIEQSDVQNEVRRASNQIVDNLRNMTDYRTTPQTGYLYIDINEMIAADYNPSISFEISGHTLTLYVSADRNGKSFDLTSTISLNNFSGSLSTYQNVRLYYKLPEDSAYTSTFATIVSTDATLSSFIFELEPSNWSAFTSSNPLPSSYTFLMSDETVPDISNIVLNDSNATYTYSKASDFSDFSEIVVTAEDGVSNQHYRFYFSTSLSLFEVNFDKNGGDTEASPATYSVASGAYINPLPTEPSRSGFQFSEWNTASDGSGASFDVTTEITSNMTVYAQWTEILNVTFHKNGGDTDANPASATILKGSSLGSLPSEPTRTNYAFIGWNTSNDGTGTVVDAAYTVNADSVFYAQWQISFPFSSASNGDYFSINGELFQKISAAQLLKRTNTGDANWNTAQTSGSSYYTGLSKAWIIGSGLLSKTTTDSLQEDIRDNNSNWWLLTEQNDNRHYYVNTSGTLQHNKDTESYGIRPYITIDNSSRDITGGVGTLSNPYTLD
jgi:uncharacterized repeat protein (TIGR02543 family)